MQILHKENKEHCGLGNLNYYIKGHNYEIKSKMYDMLNHNYGKSQNYYKNNYFQLFENKL